MFSTNLTLFNWFEQLYTFIDVLKNYDRNFHINIQMSLDGPEYINDIGRGKGTTKAFLENYYRFIEEIPINLPDNIKLSFWFKPTLSVETIELLQEKEKVIDYFTFFDNLTDKAKQIKDFRIDFTPALPNTACPSPHTQENGKKFANYCKLCYEISKENKEKKYFKHYHNIVSFSKTETFCDEKHCGFCGGGITAIGMLPEEKISICHSGFTELMEKYKEMAANSDDFRSVVKELFCHVDIFSSCMTFEDFKKYQEMMIHFQKADSQAAFNNLVLMIRVLAKNNQIDKKYAKEKEAIEAAYFYSTHVSNCFRDNMNVSGSILIPPVGLIKILFNGAKEYISASERIL
jgi:hypothetical protein